MTYNLRQVVRPAWLLLSLSCAASAHAQQTQSASPKAPSNAAEVDANDASVTPQPTAAGSENATHATADPAPTATPGAAGSAPASSIVDALTSDSDAGFNPSLHWQLFADVNLSASNAKGSHPSFNIGGVDFFITGVISSYMRLLSENMLEFGMNGEAGLDLERIYLELDLTSWLSIRAGRDHIALGRYMTAFHHALLFQLTTERPHLLAFEDDGGFFAAHQIGVEALGKFALGDAVVLRYTLGVGNGRGHITDDVLSSFDRNGFKSITARVTIEPLAVDGLELGISGYLDRIPGGYVDPTTQTVLIPEDISELIGAAHAVYLSYPFDASVEAYVLNHRGRTTHDSTNLVGGFAQFGVSFGDFTPYARYEHVQRSAGDVFYNASGVVTRIDELRLGVRYSFNAQAVLKLEYIGDFENNLHAAQLQAAFGI
jgi:hypothetical protein